MIKRNLKETEALDRRKTIKDEVLLGILLIGLFQLYNTGKTLKEHMDACAKSSQNAQRILVGIGIIVVAQLILSHVHLN